MSTESAPFRLRMSRDMVSAISAAASRDSTTPSDLVRTAVAVYLGRPELAAMREPGRPAGDTQECAPTPVALVKEVSIRAFKCALRAMQDQSGGDWKVTYRESPYSVTVADAAGIRPDLLRQTRGAGPAIMREILDAITRNGLTTEYDWMPFTGREKPRFAKAAALLRRATDPDKTKAE